MKQLILILTSIIVLRGIVQAQSLAYLLISPGAAAAGRGETGVADATDAFAGYWNPAALAFLPGFEMVLQAKRWLLDPADGIYYFAPGLRYNVPAIGTFGGYFFYLNLGEQMRTDELGNELGIFHSYMAAYAVSFSTQVSPLSSIGFNVKRIIKELSEFGMSSEEATFISKDFAFDLGYYRRQLLFSRLDVGLNIQNIVLFQSFIDKDLVHLAPANLKCGIKWRIVETDKGRLSLLYDLNKSLIASYPNIDYDGNGIIGGYDAEGATAVNGEYGRDGKREAAHFDPWYLALITSWFDDWLYGGDVDRNGDGIINPDEEGNRKEGSLKNELNSIVHNIGIECWLTSHFALRTGFIYDKLGKIWNPTFGAGIHFGGFRADLGYIYGEEGHPLTDLMCYSFNWAF